MVVNKVKSPINRANAPTTSQQPFSQQRQNLPSLSRNSSKKGSHKGSKRGTSEKRAGRESDRDESPLPSAKRRSIVRGETGTGSVVSISPMKPPNVFSARSSSNLVGDLLTSLSPVKQTGTSTKVANTNAIACANISPTKPAGFSSKTVYSLNRPTSANRTGVQAGRQSSAEVIRQSSAQLNRPQRMRETPRKPTVFQSPNKPGYLQSASKTSLHGSASKPRIYQSPNKGVPPSSSAAKQAADYVQFIKQRTKPSANVKPPNVDAMKPPSVTPKKPTVLPSAVPPSTQQPPTFELNTKNLVFEGTHQTPTPQEKTLAMAGRRVRTPIASKESPKKRTKKKSRKAKTEEQEAVQDEPKKYDGIPPRSSSSASPVDNLVFLGDKKAGQWVQAIPRDDGSQQAEESQSACKAGDADKLEHFPIASKSDPSDSIGTNSVKSGVTAKKSDAKLNIGNVSNVSAKSHAVAKSHANAKSSNRNSNKKSMDVDKKSFKASNSGTSSAQLLPSSSAQSNSSFKSSSSGFPPRTTGFPPRTVSSEQFERDAAQHNAASDSVGTNSITSLPEMKSDQDSATNSIGHNNLIANSMQEEAEMSFEDSIQNNSVRTMVQDVNQNEENSETIVQVTEEISESIDETSIVVEVGSPKTGVSTSMSATSLTSPLERGGDEKEYVFGRDEDCRDQGYSENLNGSTSHHLVESITNHDKKFNLNSYHLNGRDNDRDSFYGSARVSDNSASISSTTETTRFIQDVVPRVLFVPGAEPEGSFQTGSFGDSIAGASFRESSIRDRESFVGGNSLLERGEIAIERESITEREDSFVERESITSEIPSNPQHSRSVVHLLKPLQAENSVNCMMGEEESFRPMREEESSGPIDQESVPLHPNNTDIYAVNGQVLNPSFFVGGEGGITIMNQGTDRNLKISPPTSEPPPPSQDPIISSQEPVLSSHESPPSSQQENNSKLNSSRRSPDDNSPSRRSPDSISLESRPSPPTRPVPPPTSVEVEVYDKLMNDQGNNPDAEKTIEETNDVDNKKVRIHALSIGRQNNEAADGRFGDVEVLPTNSVKDARVNREDSAKISFISPRGHAIVEKESSVSGLVSQYESYSPPKTRPNITPWKSSPNINPKENVNPPKGIRTDGSPKIRSPFPSKDMSMHKNRKTNEMPSQPASSSEESSTSSQQPVSSSHEEIFVSEIDSKIDSREDDYIKCNPFAEHEPEKKEKVLPRDPVKQGTADEFSKRDMVFPNATTDSKNEDAKKIEDAYPHSKIENSVPEFSPQDSNQSASLTLSMTDSDVLKRLDKMLLQSEDLLNQPELQALQEEITLLQDGTGSDGNAIPVISTIPAEEEGGNNLQENTSAQKDDIKNVLAGELPVAHATGDLAEDALGTSNSQDLPPVSCSQNDLLRSQGKLLQEQRGLLEESKPSAVKVGNATQDNDVTRSSSSSENNNIKSTSSSSNDAIRNSSSSSETLIKNGLRSVEKKEALNDDGRSEVGSKRSSIAYLVSESTIMHNTLSQSSIIEGTATEDEEFLKRFSFDSNIEKTDVEKAHSSRTNVKASTALAAGPTISAASQPYPASITHPKITDSRDADLDPLGGSQGSSPRLDQSELPELPDRASAGGNPDTFVNTGQPANSLVASFVDSAFSVPPNSSICGSNSDGPLGKSRGSDVLGHAQLGNSQGDSQLGISQQMSDNDDEGFSFDNQRPHLDGEPLASKSSSASEAERLVSKRSSAVSYSLGSVPTFAGRSNRSSYEGTALMMTENALQIGGDDMLNSGNELQQSHPGFWEERKGGWKSWKPTEGETKSPTACVVSKQSPREIAMDRKNDVIITAQTKPFSDSRSPSPNKRAENMARSSTDAVNISGTTVNVAENGNTTPRNTNTGTGKAPSAVSVPPSYFPTLTRSALFSGTTPRRSAMEGGLNQQTDEASPQQSCTQRSYQSSYMGMEDSALLGDSFNSLDGSQIGSARGSNVGNSVPGSARECTMGSANESVLGSSSSPMEDSISIQGGSALGGSKLGASVESPKTNSESPSIKRPSKAGATSTRSPPEIPMITPRTPRDPPPTVPTLLLSSAKKTKDGKEGSRPEELKPDSPLTSAKKSAGARLESSRKTPGRTPRKADDQIIPRKTPPKEKENSNDDDDEKEENEKEDTAQKDNDDRQVTPPVYRTKERISAKPLNSPPLDTRAEAGVPSSSVSPSDPQNRSPLTSARKEEAPPPDDPPSLVTARDDADDAVTTIYILKIDPKVFFSTERTFLSWMRLVTVINMMAVFLLQYSLALRDEIWLTTEPEDLWKAKYDPATHKGGGVTPFNPADDWLFPFIVIDHNTNSSKIVWFRDPTARVVPVVHRSFANSTNCDSNSLYRTSNGTSRRTDESGREIVSGMRQAAGLTDPAHGMVDGCSSPYAPMNGMANGSSSYATMNGNVTNVGASRGVTGTSMSGKSLMNGNASFLGSHIENPGAGNLSIVPSDLEHASLNHPSLQPPLFDHVRANLTVVSKNGTVVASGSVSGIFGTVTRPNKRPLRGIIVGNPQVDRGSIFLPFSVSNNTVVIPYAEVHSYLRSDPQLRNATPAEVANEKVHDGVGNGVTASSKDTKSSNDNVSHANATAVENSKFILVKSAAAAKKSEAQALEKKQQEEQKQKERQRDERQEEKQKTQQQAQVKTREQEQEELKEKEHQAQREKVQREKEQKGEAQKEKEQKQKAKEKKQEQEQEEAKKEEHHAQREKAQKKNEQKAEPQKEKEPKQKAKEKKQEEAKEEEHQAQRERAQKKNEQKAEAQKEKEQQRKAQVKKQEEEKDEEHQAQREKAQREKEQKAEAQKEKEQKQKAQEKKQEEEKDEEHQAQREEAQREKEQKAAAQKEKEQKQKAQEKKQEEGKDEEHQAQREEAQREKEQKQEEKKPKEHSQEEKNQQEQQERDEKEKQNEQEEKQQNPKKEKQEVEDDEKNQKQSARGKGRQSKSKKLKAKKTKRTEQSKSRKNKPNNNFIPPAVFLAERIALNPSFAQYLAYPTDPDAYGNDVDPYGEDLDAYATPTDEYADDFSLGVNDAADTYASEIGYADPYGIVGNADPTFYDTDQTFDPYAEFNPDFEGYLDPNGGYPDAEHLGNSDIGGYSNPITAISDYSDGPNFSSSDYVGDSPSSALQPVDSMEDYVSQTQSGVQPTRYSQSDTQTDSDMQADFDANVDILPTGESKSETVTPSSQSAKSESTNLKPQATNQKKQNQDTADSTTTTHSAKESGADQESTDSHSQSLHSKYAEKSDRSAGNGNGKPTSGNHTAAVVHATSPQSKSFFSRIAAAWKSFYDTVEGWKSEFEVPWDNTEETMSELCQSLFGFAHTESKQLQITLSKLANTTENTIDWMEKSLNTKLEDAHVAIGNSTEAVGTSFISVYHILKEPTVQEKVEGSAQYVGKVLYQSLILVLNTTKYVVLISTHIIFVLFQYMMIAASWIWAHFLLPLGGYLMYVLGNLPGATYIMVSTIVSAAYIFVCTIFQYIWDALESANGFLHSVDLRTAFNSVLYVTPFLSDYSNTPNAGSVTEHVSQTFFSFVDQNQNLILADNLAIFMLFYSICVSLVVYYNFKVRMQTLEQGAIVQIESRRNFERKYSVIRTGEWTDGEKALAGRSLGNGVLGAGGDVTPACYDDNNHENVPFLRRIAFLCSFEGLFQGLRRFCGGIGEICFYICRTNMWTHSCRVLFDFLYLVLNIFLQCISYILGLLFWCFGCCGHFSSPYITSPRIRRVVWPHNTGQQDAESGQLTGEDGSADGLGGGKRSSAVAQKEKWAAYGQKAVRFSIWNSHEKIFFLICTVSVVMIVIMLEMVVHVNDVMLKLSARKNGILGI